MSDTTYIDYTQPAVNAAWLNEINDHVWHDTPVAGTTVHTAAAIKNIPSGTLVSTDVQAAINELDVNNTFIQAGTGATSRTPQNKMRERVSAEDFYLASDPDSTAMLQRALNSGAKIVDCGQGASYTISSTLTIPTGVYINGNAATFTTGTHFKVLDFANGGGVYNLNMIGAGGATYTSGSIAIGCSGTNNAPAAPTYVAGPVIEGCKISGYGEYGIFFEYVKIARVCGNKITNIGYAAIGGVSCEDVVVDGNIIKDITAGSAGGDAYGIFMDRNNGTSETAEPRSYRCIITNNTISNISATAADNGHAIDTHGGVEILISGNIIKNCEGGIYLTASTISGLQALGPLRCTVSNNVISGGFNGYGIIVYGARNGGSGVEWAEDCIVSGNVVSGHGLKTSDTVPGVLLSFTKNCSFTGNVLKECGGSCLMLDQSNIGFHVSGNEFIDPQSTTYSAATCILVYSNDNRGLVSDNVYKFVNAGLATYVAVNSVVIKATLTGLDLDFSRSTFQGITASHLTFSASTTSGVRYAGLNKEVGSSTIAVSSTGIDGITDVTFSKRFPYIPKVFPVLRYPFNQGGKFPLLGIDTVTAISATGFRIYAKPYDGTTWTATGSLSFDWQAE